MSHVEDERGAALRDKYEMWAAVRDHYEPHLRNEQELRFASRIRALLREEPCECPAPAPPAGLDNPNVPAQYRTVFAHTARAASAVCPYKLPRPTRRPLALLYACERACCVCSGAKRELPH